jgi:CRISPR-associated protein Csd1
MPRLLATAQHHLSALRRADKVGLARFIGTSIEDITAHLGTAFPRVLNTSEQGQFALGYFHQRGYRKAKLTDSSTEVQER